MIQIGKKILGLGNLQENLEDIYIYILSLRKLSYLSRKKS